MVVFFFFQAEDGIRDVAVTGVQTCALPDLSWFLRRSSRLVGSADRRIVPVRLGRAWRRLRRQPNDHPAIRLPGYPPPRQRDRESGVEGKRGDLGGGRII